MDKCHICDTDKALMALVCVDCLERLCPAGSIPASCCPARGAVGEQDAVTISDTASPLPDQGRGAIGSSERLSHFNAWESSEVGARACNWLTLTGNFEANLRNRLYDAYLAGIAVGLHHAAPLTQSAADGAQVCPHCGKKRFIPCASLPPHCWDCGWLADRSGIERSVSGNDQGHPARSK